MGSSSWSYFKLCDAAQLWRRMVFNILISNTDDHLRNHGKFALGGRTYDFRVKPTFPKKLSREFLLVDLVNNLHQLGESADEVLERVKARLAVSDRARVKKAAQTYGSERAKKFFARALAEVRVQDAA